MKIQLLGFILIVRKCLKRQKESIVNKVLLLLSFMQVFIPLSAQPDTVSTYPPPGLQTFGIRGITFEVVNTSYINLQKFELSSNLLNNEVEIYYRKGGVQHIPGSPPDINGNGWNYLGTYTFTSGSSLIPVAIDQNMDLILAPDTTGFYIHHTIDSYINFGRWTVNDPTTFTNPGAAVKILTGPDRGYRAASSGIIPNDTLHFLGSVIYEEFPHVDDDISIHSIEIPGLHCSGTNNIAVNLRNLGSTQISSVNIQWQVNGGAVQTYNFSGLIDTIGRTGSIDTTIIVGTTNLSAGQEIEIKAWTSMPNGNVDPVPDNDTASVVTPTAMSGSYTIDPINGDFTTFNKAVEELEKRGVCNPVIFNVATGVYEEHIAIPSIAGASATNTITFKGNAGSAELEYKCPAGSSDSNYVVKLNGCGHVIFEGIKMTSLGTSETKVLVYENGAHHNTIKNCQLIAPLSTSISSTSYPVIYADESKAIYNRIEDNIIYGGSYGIRYRGSPYDYIPGLVISGNTIEEPYYYGIYIFYAKDVVVDQNTIFSNSSRSSTSYGIRLSDCYGARITGNRIRTGTEWPRYGIRIERSYGVAARKLLIANNMVHAGGPTQSSSAVTGLYVDDSDTIDILHNTIAVEGSGSSSAALTLGGGGSFGRIVNNNFIHMGAGYAVVNSTLFQMDFNNLFSNGTNLCHYIHNGGSQYIVDLISWQITGWPTFN